MFDVDLYCMEVDHADVVMETTLPISGGSAGSSDKRWPYESRQGMYTFSHARGWKLMNPTTA